MEREVNQIIGLEFRFIDICSGRVREVKLIPVEIPYPSRQEMNGMQMHCNITVHTSRGDVTLDSRNGTNGLP